jgi:hypothetical protein
MLTSLLKNSTVSFNQISRNQKQGTICHLKNQFIIFQHVIVSPKTISFGDDSDESDGAVEIFPVLSRTGNIGGFHKGR